MARTRFLGKDKVKRRFLALPEKAREHIAAEFGQGATKVVNQMRRRAPYDPKNKSGHHLRDSITWTWGNQKIAYSQGGGPVRSGEIAIRISAGNTFVRYAHIAEFGAAPHVVGGQFAGAMHPGQAAQPFFYVTWRAERRSFKARQKRALRRAIAASANA